MFLLFFYYSKTAGFVKSNDLGGIIKKPLSGLCPSNLPVKWRPNRASNRYSFPATEKPPPKGGFAWRRLRDTDIPRKRGPCQDFARRTCPSNGDRTALQTDIHFTLRQNRPRRAVLLGGTCATLIELFIEF